jgi:hypothetical protein
MIRCGGRAAYLVGMYLGLTAGAGVSGTENRVVVKTREIRRVREVMDEPNWLRLPIAQLRRRSSQLVIPRYCETERCQSRRRAATTFHALIALPGEPDRAWVACTDCTGLMVEGMH